MIGDKTLLQNIIEEELREFIANNEVIYENTGVVLDVEKHGSFLLELNSASTAFKKAISEEYQTKIANMYKADPHRYRTQLGERIIKLDKDYSFKDAMNIIYETTVLVKDKFAGALLILESGAIINPFHPLVALEMLKISNTTFVKKVLVYTYKNMDEIDEVYTSTEHEFNAEENVKLLLQMYQSQTKDRGVKILENEVDFERRKITQRYQIAKYEGEDDTKEYYIVAHQLLTNGTYVPYYGTSLIQMNGNTSGYHLSPFKSCNISGHESTHPSNVCTGSTSNKTIRGLRTLHHANLGSPYESWCMTVHAKQYAEECIKQSISIYKAASILPKD